MPRAICVKAATCAKMTAHSGVRPRKAHAIMIRTILAGFQSSCACGGAYQSPRSRRREGDDGRERGREGEREGEGGRERRRDGKSGKRPPMGSELGDWPRIGGCAPELAVLGVVATPARNEARRS